MEVKEQFHRRCQAVADKYQALSKDTGFLLDQRQIIPELDFVVELVRLHSDHKDELLPMFAELVDSIDLAFTPNGKKQAALIIRHCGFNLDWPELAQMLAQRFRDERNPSILRIIYGLLDDITLQRQGERSAI